MHIQTQPPRGGYRFVIGLKTQLQTKRFQVQILYYVSLWRKMYFNQLRCYRQPLHQISHCYVVAIFISASKTNPQAQN